jgi:TetR/AcrR family transcriptional regulator, mexJK operon transcriptional repressor
VVPQLSTTDDSGRSERSRQAIIRAATEVFLRSGYLGATTDEVAARASVSKQTIYRRFGDKEHLFAAVILDKATTVVDEVFCTIADALQGAKDVREALHDLAHAFLDGLLTPDVIQMRRLVIAEADRFPDIARTWFDRGFERALPIVGGALSELASRGMLHNLSDPVLAAYQFAGLVMYQPMNYVMFAGTDAVPSAESLNRTAESAIDVFLAMYG